MSPIESQSVSGQMTLIGVWNDIALVFPKCRDRMLIFDDFEISYLYIPLYLPQNIADIEMMPTSGT